MRTRLRTVAMAAVIFLLNLGSRARAAAIYWADFDGGTIRTANLDGTGKRTLVTGQNLPVGPTPLSLTSQYVVLQTRDRDMREKIRSINDDTVRLLQSIASAKSNSPVRLAALAS